MKSNLLDLKSVEPSIRNVWLKYVNKGLTYGWKSNIKKHFDFGHWNNMLLPDSKYFVFDHGSLPYIEKYPDVKKIWNEIQKYVGKKYLMRAYVNAYTYGTDAYYHVDDENKKREDGSHILSQTVIVYLNDNWDPDWGGETTILGDDKEIEFSVLPKKNRALIFDASLLHSARPLARCCPVLRAVLVLKMVDGKDIDERISFIHKNTKDIPHSGKTFFEHLFNTSIILEKEKQRKELCFAALYHSVYGSEFFNFDNKNFTRDKVKELIGEEAEKIVFEFCDLKKDRFETIVENRKNYESDFRKDLMYLEFANLLEQNNKGQYNNKLAVLKKEIDKLK